MKKEFEKGLKSGLIDYRRILIKEVCDVKCPYYDVCGLDEQYDCEAFKILVRIYEVLDSSNPNN